MLFCHLGSKSGSAAVVAGGAAYHSKGIRRLEAAPVGREQSAGRGGVGGEGGEGGGGGEEVNVREKSGRMVRTAAVDRSVSYGSEKDRSLSETDAEVNNRMASGADSFVQRLWSQSASSDSLSTPPTPHSPHSAEVNRQLSEVEVTSAQIITGDCGNNDDDNDDVFHSEVEKHPVSGAPEEQSLPESSPSGGHGLPSGAEPTESASPAEESSFADEIRKQIASARSSFAAMILNDQFDWPPPPPSPLGSPPPPPLPSSAPPPLPFSPPSAPAAPAPFTFNATAASGPPHFSITTYQEVFSLLLLLLLLHQTNQND